MADVLPTRLFGAHQRKLMIGAIETFLKEKLPMEREKAVAELMYQTGFKEDTVKEYIKLFRKRGNIKRDEKNGEMLVWVSVKG